MKNHYEILELQPKASREEIEKAYQLLSKEFHPDKNGGVAYFDEMYNQIIEAYSVLSEESLRMDYDIEKGFVQVEKPEEEITKKEPEVVFFETDKDIFEEGDSITLTWETKNADEVIINPFGEVEKTGSKIYRLKNYNKEHLTVTLEIKNFESGETTSKSLTLKNKVTEIDFSNINNQNPDGNTFENKDEESHAHLNTYTETIDQSASKEIKESFFSSKGRLRRSTYLLRTILLAVPIIFLYFGLDSSLNYYYAYDESTIIFFGLTLIVFSYLSILQFIKRLHDIDMSGWWFLLTLIPYVGSLFGLIIMFIDGSKGPNRFGEDPKGRM